MTPLEQKFQGGGESNQKNHLWVGYGYFLESHNELLCTNLQTEDTNGPDNVWASCNAGQVTAEILVFHRNDILGTLTFTGSENWATFSFPKGQPCVLVVVFFFLICFISNLSEPCHTQNQQKIKKFD